MSFSPMTDGGSRSPSLSAPPRVTMCLDDQFINTQEMKENMKVYCRIRPMLDKEEEAGYRKCVAAIDDDIVRAVVPVSSQKFKNSVSNGQEIYEDFTYSQAFGPEIGQFVFFEQTIMDSMKSFIEGVNCLIFSYGITNSGKTYTLQGNDSEPGVIPMALNLFFATIQHQLLDGISVKPDKFSEIMMLDDSSIKEEHQLKDYLLRTYDQEMNKTANSSCFNNSSKSFGMILLDCFYDDFKYDAQTTLPPEQMIAGQTALYMKQISKEVADQQAGNCSIWVSFIEIYNEFIYDLLQLDLNNRKKLNLAEDQNGDVYVKDAREVCVSNSTEAIKLLNLGRRNLRIASTKLNYQSSRSHCIFTVRVVRLFDDEDGQYCGRVNRISFCDLAGSERASKSQTSGIRLKEAGYINSSLLVLGRCLDQLRLNQSLKDKKMIPYRESKLTRMFSGHFMGKGKAVMIANASPSEYTFDETLNVLRFSALAKELQLNDTYASSSLQSLTNEWTRSKLRLTDVSLNQSDSDSSFYEEELRGREEFVEKLLEIAGTLQTKLNEVTKEKIELEAKVRKEVVEEYSAYSDKLLEDQKNNLWELHKNHVADLEKMHKEKIDELLARLEEAEASEVEDSFNSACDKINETFERKSVEFTNKWVFSSPAVHYRDKEETPRKSEDYLKEMEEREKIMEENNNLKNEVELVRRELEILQAQLQECTKTISNLQDASMKDRLEFEEQITKLQNEVQIKVESLEAEKDLQDFTSLKDDLDSVTAELELTKEQLQLNADALKESQIDASIAK